MKFETSTLEDGQVNLKLGLNHSVTFDKEISLEEIVLGVQMLIEKVTDISSFDLVKAVMDEYAKADIKAPANDPE